MILKTFKLRDVIKDCPLTSWRLTLTFFHLNVFTSAESLWSHHTLFLLDHKLLFAHDLANFAFSLSFFLSIFLSVLLKLCPSILFLSFVCFLFIYFYLSFYVPTSCMYQQVFCIVQLFRGVHNCLHCLLSPFFFLTKQRTSDHPQNIFVSGRFHQNFLAKRKNAGAQGFSKKLMFNFTSN